MDRRNKGGSGSAEDGIYSKLLLQQQQFDTESSVSEWRGDAREEAMRQKIMKAERKLCQIQTRHGSQIGQQRVQLRRLTQKEASTASQLKSTAVLWATSWHQLIATAQYFLSKLKDVALNLFQHHESVSAQIRLSFRHRLQVLHSQLEQHQARRAKLTSLLCQSGAELTQSKQEVREWLRRNLLSKQSAALIHTKIGKQMQNFQRVLHQQKIKKIKDYEKARTCIQELAISVSEYIEQQKIKREQNKERILQIFQSLLRTTKLSAY